MKTSTALIAFFTCCLVSCSGTEDDSFKRDHSLTGSISYYYTDFVTKIYKDGILIQDNPGIIQLEIIKTAESKVNISYFGIPYREGTVSYSYSVYGVEVIGEPYNVQFSTDSDIRYSFGIGDEIYIPTDIELQGWMKSESMLQTRDSLTPPPYEGKITAAFTFDDGSVYLVDITL